MYLLSDDITIAFLSGNMMTIAWNGAWYDFSQNFLGEWLKF